MKISRECGRLPATTHGYGIAFASPIKRRAPTRKNAKISTCFNPQMKISRLQARLDKLSGNDITMDIVDEEWVDEGDSRTDVGAGVDSQTSLDTVDTGMDDENPSLGTDNMCSPTTPIQPISPNPPKTNSKKSRRLNPDKYDINLYSKWQETIPTLVDDLLKYYSDTFGRPIQPVKDELEESCPSGICSEMRSSKLLCLYFECMSSCFLHHYISNDIH